MNGFFGLKLTSLSSSIPTELGQLTAMQEGFLLEGAAFTGVIPTQLGRMTDMYQYFNLHDNALELEIPTQLGALTEMITQVREGTGQGGLCQAPRVLS